MSSIKSLTGVSEKLETADLIVKEESATKRPKAKPKRQMGYGYSVGNAC